MVHALFSVPVSVCCEPATFGIAVGAGYWYRLPGEGV